VSPGALARVLRAAADEADRIAAEERADRREWVDQAASPLGRRRHVAAVRRRVAAGDAAAALVGRRALLSAQALSAELAALSSRPRKRVPLVETTATRLERRLGLVGGCR
jgi:hypothetical protein